MSTSNFTGRTHRTMDSAFGAHASHIITEPKPFTDWDGVAIILGCIAVVVVFYAWLWGGI